MAFKESRNNDFKKVNARKLSPLVFVCLYIHFTLLLTFCSFFCSMAASCFRYSFSCCDTRRSALRWTLWWFTAWRVSSTVLTWSRGREVEGPESLGFGDSPWSQFATMTTGLWSIDWSGVPADSYPLLSFGQLAAEAQRLLILAQPLLHQAAELSLYGVCLDRLRNQETAAVVIKQSFTSELFTFIVKSIQLLVFAWIVRVIKRQE